MSEDLNQLQERINELEKELATAKSENNFDEIKAKYETIIEDKNNEIAELNNTLTETKQQVDTTIGDLNSEVQAKLEANEKLAELNATVEELVRDKAEATVDTFIQQGKILPAQRDTALKLCLNDNDTFLELYRDAKPIIDTNTKPVSKRITGDLNRLVDYMKS